MTLKIGPRQTRDTFSVALDYITPGSGPPPHVHRREDEMFYVLEGTLRFTDDRHSVLAGPGSTAYMRTGTPHTLQNVGDTPARTLVITTPCGFEAFTTECGEPIDRIPCGRDVTPADVERALAIAPKHGIDFVADFRPGPEAPSRPNDRRLWVLGHLIALKLTSDDTAGRFTVCDIATPPGGFVPPHRHRAMDEFFYVLDGTYEFLLGDDARPHHAPAGTFVHVPPGVTHGFRNPGPAPARLVDFHTPSGFERFFLECGTPCTDPTTPPPAAAPPDPVTIAALFDRHGMDLPPPRRA
jgi:quercetin dioxygenase-like cupin family protein